MDIEDGKEAMIDKKLVNKLLKKLTSLFYDELKTACDAAGFHLTDLMPKPKETFAEKGTPNDVESVRFLHYEQNRIAKILKILNDIGSNADIPLYKSQSTINMMKHLGIQVVSNRKFSRNTSLSAAENYKTFHKPQDIIQYNYDKEKEKYQKSLQMIEKISNIKEEAQRKVEQKLKMFAEREKKLMDDKKKKEEEHGKHTQIQIEKRKQILNKKYQIEQNINHQCIEIGQMLETRMQQLTEREKKDLREKILRKQEKIKQRINNDFLKILMDEKKIKEEEKEVEVMIRELQKKIESRVRKYESNVKKRIQTARSHSEKVEQVFSQNLKEESAKQEEKIKKIVHKSMICEEKKDKKTEISKENAEKLKNVIEKSFNRHSRVVQDVNFAEIKRLEEIEQRGSKKRKTFNLIKSNIEKLYKEKKHINNAKERNHSAKYNKTQQSHVNHI
jgi:hypothetical protein